MHVLSLRHVGTWDGFHSIMKTEGVLGLWKDGNPIACGLHLRVLEVRRDKRRKGGREWRERVEGEGME